jgi:hypothetical protein
LCLLQPCPESGEFREQQCAAYNDVPYEAALLIWTAHHDDSEPCALTCRGRPADEPLTQEEPIVVQLAPKVQDGTRCRPGSLDMCINGKCQVSAALSLTLRKQYYCLTCILTVDFSITLSATQTLRIASNDWKIIINLFCNPILLAICTSTFSKLCKNIYVMACKRVFSNAPL